MESFLKSSRTSTFCSRRTTTWAGAVAAIKAAGKVPGKDIIIVGCDSVKAAFDAIIAGEMNATIECTPLYYPFVVACIKDLENGKDLRPRCAAPRGVRL